MGTIKTSGYSTIARDFLAREDVTEPGGNTSQAGEASCSISQAYSYATTIARDYPDDWDSPMPGKQQLTATTAATTMPELQGAVARMRERMAKMSFSFGEERKETNTHQGKNAFANLIAKFEVEPSSFKLPKDQNFLSQRAQQPVRLSIAIPSYHEQSASSPHASTASHHQNEREISDS